MKLPEINPKKDYGKLSVLIVAGTVIGGLFGSDVFKFIYHILDWPYPGK